MYILPYFLEKEAKNLLKIRKCIIYFLFGR